MNLEILKSLVFGSLWILALVIIWVLIIGTIDTYRESKRREKILSDASKEMTNEIMKLFTEDEDEDDVEL